MTSEKKKLSPWAWLPTLYFFQGMPYAIAMLTSVVMFKSLGISASKIAFWTSIIYLPWALKFIWSPFVDITSTKRNWVVTTQMILGFSFIALAFTINLPTFFAASIAVLFAVAFSSASHDIAADGFYMLGLNQHDQAFFVGIRSTFYRIAMISAMGAIPIVAGLMEEKTGLEPVDLKIHAVKTLSQQAFNPDTLQIIPTEEIPKILIYPDNIEIALYDAATAKNNPTGKVSDTCVAYVVLSSPPKKDDKLVVNIRLSDGPKDIFLKNEGRLEFTEKNWNKPAKVVFKIHPNLKENITTTYRATAGNTQFAWAVALVSLGILLLLLAIYHKVILPKPESLLTLEKAKVSLKVFKDVFVSFFSKPGVVPAVVFFLIYRLGEGQLIKIVPMFFLDSLEKGGLGLTTAQYGLAYGFTAPIFLTLGGISGGIVAAKYGLKKLILLMAIIMSSPIAVYLYLSVFQPTGLHWSIFGSIALEQFGYGFGFTAYMLYMLNYVGDSKYKTAEFALATSLMALGMMLPGMISGVVQEMLGYKSFFIYVMICAIPGIFVVKMLTIDAAFGLKKKEE